MGERYTPPEARGESMLAKLRKGAEKKWAALGAMAVAGMMAGEHRAHAETPDLGNLDKVEKKTAGGETNWFQAVDAKGGVVTLLEIVKDNETPDDPTDDFRLKENLYREKSKDGTAQWTAQRLISGTISPGENPFGRVSGFPESILKGKKGNVNMARAHVNFQLEQFREALIVIKGFDTVGKSNTPEAQYVLGDLQKGVKKFQVEHPDIPIPDATLKLVFSDEKK